VDNEESKRDSARCGAHFYKSGGIFDSNVGIRLLPFSTAVLCDTLLHSESKKGATKIVLSIHNFTK